MASRNRSETVKSKAADAEESHFLRGGRDNNVLDFKEFLKRECGEEYGFLANLFDTDGEVFVPRPVAVGDYTPTLAAGMDQIPAAGLNRLRERAEMDRNKVVAGLRDMRPKLYATIKKSISTGSWATIMHHPDFSANESDKDPHGLWKIILLTHLTAVDGDDPDMKVHNQNAIEKKFAALKQEPTDTLSDFKVRFDGVVKVMAATGCAKKTEASLAAIFLDKLDARKFGQMNVDLRNGMHMGIKYPKTMFDAWVVASTRLTAGGEADSRAANYQSVFLADDTRPEYTVKKKKKTGGGSERGAAGGGKSGGETAAAAGSAAGTAGRKSVGETAVAARPAAGTTDTAGDRP
jgi:hypothetical protein